MCRWCVEERNRRSKEALERMAAETVVRLAPPRRPVLVDETEGYAASLPPARA